MIPILTLAPGDVLKLACACGDGVELKVNLADVEESKLRQLRDAITEWIGE